MRLYIIDRVTLDDIAAHPDGPGPGDIVTFWRHAQVAGGGEDALRARGVTLEWAEARVDAESAKRIDQFIDRFGRNWALTDGNDDTVVEGFSFADQVTRELHNSTKINLLVRYGHVFADLFAAYPGTTEIITDFIDGTNWLAGGKEDPNALQRRALLRALATRRGIACRDFAVDNPIPPTGFYGHEPVFFPFFRTLIGGFRPRYLRARLALRLRRKRRPRAYVFMTAGLRNVAEKLAENRDIEVLGDWQNCHGVTPLRYDHFLAFPTWPILRAARNMLRQSRRVEADGFTGDLALYRDMDFTPFFAPAIRRLARQEIIPAIMATAQTFRMMRLADVDLIVINGEGSITARLVTALAKSRGVKIVFLDHSNTLVHFGYHPTGRNAAHVIYVSQGEDHVESYGRMLPDDGKPERPVLTNPAFSAMESARGKRPSPVGKRILLTNYSAAPTYTVARTALWDKFILDLLDAARMLIPEGYQFTYRPHPGYHNAAYFDFMLEKTGLTGKIAIDTVRNFPDTLPHHDLIVVNVSGCYYQALYAGWPTIFYEPGFKPDQFVGLPAATDIERPIASTPEGLAGLIREGVSRPDSLTARFPELFNTVHAPRFIGRDAAHADRVLAQFLAERVRAAAPTGQAPGEAPRNIKIAAE